MCVSRVYSHFCFQTCPPAVKPRIYSFIDITVFCRTLAASPPPKRTPAIPQIVANVSNILRFLRGRAHICTTSTFFSSTKYHIYVCVEVCLASSKSGGGNWNYLLPLRQNGVFCLYWTPNILVAGWFWCFRN